MIWGELGGRKRAQLPDSLGDSARSGVVVRRGGNASAQTGGILGNLGSCAGPAATLSCFSFPRPRCMLTPPHPPLSCRPTSPSCKMCSTTSSSWRAPWTRSSSTRTQSCSSCGPHRTGPRSCCTTSVRSRACPRLPSQMPCSWPLSQRASQQPYPCSQLSPLPLLCPPTLPALLAPDLRDPLFYPRGPQ